ncbi:hypothetical protein HQ489_04195 [Candidatus Woesearchaeota archaeon]|nr:hypothetical protein [Candidatus Woesearchaeota archaeon]
MAERNLVIDQLKFSYEGLFNAGELTSLISSWFLEKGWDWYEKLNQEQITPEGKQIRIILEPWKSASDYYKLAVQIKLNMTNIKDVEIQKDNQLLRLDHGVIRITFNGYVVSDRFNKWHSSPFFWFLSIIFEKYFFKNHYNKFETWIKSDVEDLHDKIQNYLNVTKYTYQK